MERDNIREYNLIFDSDNLKTIGYVEEIKRYYKNIAKNCVDIGIYNETRDVLDLLDVFDIDRLGDNDLIEVYYLDLDYKYTYNLIRRDK